MYWAQMSSKNESKQRHFSNKTPSKVKPVVCIPDQEKWILTDGLMQEEEMVTKESVKCG